MIANEAVAGCVATLLGLPVPANGIAYSNGEPYFFSADFGIDRLPFDHITPDGQAPLKASWKDAVQDNAFTSWGIALFDIWLLNDDRGPHNIRFDRDTSEFLIFDHGNCLMSWGTANSKRLDDFETKIGAQRYPSNHYIEELRGQVKNPFFRFLVAADHAEQWYDRINGLPIWQIEDAVARGQDAGYSEEVADRVLRFILQRRSTLLTLIANHFEWFPATTDAAKRKIEELATQMEGYRPPSKD